jgi:hypothetical protein
MAADPTTEKGTGFFAKLKARINRGTAWIAGDLLGIAQRPLDESTIEELETRLLTADVGVDATTWLLDEMRARNRRKAAPAAELLLDTAVGLMRTVEAPLAIDRARKPFVILAVGVNGTGKTTTVGKLAQRLKSRGSSVLLAAADTFRAAAVEQLQEWGRRAGVPVVAQAPGADPAAVVHDALVAARARNVDVVLAAALAAQAERFDVRPRIVRQDAASLLRGPPPARFDVVFLDPPYAVPVEPLLELLPPWLAADAVVYIERRADAGLPDVPGAQWWKRSRAGAVEYGLLRYDGV